MLDRSFGVECFFVCFFFFLMFNKIVKTAVCLQLQLVESAKASDTYLYGYHLPSPLYTHTLTTYLESDGESRDRRAAGGTSGDGV